MEREGRGRKKGRGGRRGLERGREEREVEGVGEGERGLKKGRRGKEKGGEKSGEGEERGEGWRRGGEGRGEETGPAYVVKVRPTCTSSSQVIVTTLLPLCYRLVTTTGLAFWRDQLCFRDDCYFSFHFSLFHFIFSVEVIS